MSVTNVSGVVWLLSGYSASGSGVQKWLTLQADNTWVQSSGYMLNARPYAQSLFQSGSWCAVGGMNIPTVAFGTSEYWSGTTWFGGPTLAGGSGDSYKIYVNGQWCLVSGIASMAAQCLSGSTWTSTPALTVPGQYRGGQFASLVLDGLPCVGDTAGVICWNGSTWTTYPGMNTPRYRYAAFTYDVPPPPTSAPTQAPTQSPTTQAPTSSPVTVAPTPNGYTYSPTFSPTTTPTTSPTTLSPTTNPTTSPTTSNPTTNAPTTMAPTTQPPTATPTQAPSFAPTQPPQELTVSYAEVTPVSQWTTFQCLSQLSSTALTQLHWVFSNGLQRYGSEITLQPFSFTIGDFSFNITNDTTSTTSSNFYFTVVGSPPVVLIMGGNKEIMSGSSVVLSANTSYDPNINGSTSSDLDYSWTVNDALPMGGGGGGGGGVNSPFLTIPTTDYPTSTTTIIIVKVNASSQSTQLWTQVSTELRIVNSAIISNVSIDGPSVMSPSDQLRLLASVTNLNQLTSFGWSVQPSLLPSSSTSASSCDLLSVSNAASTRALLVSGGCMEQGNSYRFTFTVSDGSMNTAQSWIDVTVARPPFGGTCSVSNRTGVALTTLFHIECNGWMDYNGSSSLTYSLKQQQITTNTNTNTNTNTVSLVALSTRQYQGVFDTVLNGVQADTQSTVQLIVVISGTGGDTPIQLDSITLTPLAQCPPTDAVIGQPLQYLTTVIGSPDFQLCDSTQRGILWNELWNDVSQIIDSLDYINADNMAFLARSLQSLLSTSQSISSGSSNNIPTNFTIILSNQVAKLLSVGETTEVSTQTTLSALPDTVSCDVLQSTLLSVLKSKVGELGNVRLPGETPLVLQTPQLSTTTQTFFSNQAASLGSESVSIGLSTELLDRGGSVSTVMVVDYGNTLKHCSSISGGGSNDDNNQQLQQPISNVVDITLINYGSGSRSEAVNVQGLNKGFSFSTQVVIGDASCGKPVCAWWQPSTIDNDNTNNNGEWSRDGCFTGPTPNAPDNVTCTCTHLTEFSLILRPGCVSPTYRALYYVALAGYATILTMIITKVSYRQWKFRTLTTSDTTKKSIRVILWQHFMLAILAIARIVACVVLASNRQDWNVADRAVVLLIPFMIEFWVFTLVAFQWASIYHFGMKTSKPFVRVRVLFIITNLLVVACIVATIVVISSASPPTSPTQSSSSSSSSSSRAGEAVAIAAGVTSGFTFLTAIGFLVYAIPLYRGLSVGGNSNVATGRRVMVGAVLLCVLLLFQSLLHLSSAVNRIGMEAIVGGDASEVVELAADIFCIAILLTLYHSSLHASPSTRDTQTNISSNNKVEKTKSLELVSMN